MFALAEKTHIEPSRLLGAGPLWASVGCLEPSYLLVVEGKDQEVLSLNPMFLACL